MPAQKPKLTPKQAGKTGALVRKGLPVSTARKIAAPNKPRR